MSLGAPWFLYMLLTGFAMRAIGQKIMSLIENLLGSPSGEEIAGKASTVAKSSAMQAKGGIEKGVSYAARGARPAGRASVRAATAVGRIRTPFRRE